MRIERDVTLGRDLPPALAQLVQTRGVLMQPWAEEPAGSTLPDAASVYP